MAGLNRVVQPSDLTAGRLRTEIKKEIDKLDYDQTPLLAILLKIGKESSGQMKFDYLTKERQPDWGGIASYGGAWAAAAATSGTITVTAGEGWMYGAGDIIKVPATSNVNIYVDIVLGDVLTCRTYDNTQTIDFTAGATGTLKLLSISNTFALGTNRGTMKSHQPDAAFNYIQIIQHPFGNVETLAHVNYDAGGPELKENEEDAWLAHELSKEKLLFFGQKHYAASGYMTYQGQNLAQYFTGGLHEAISLNTIPGAVLTEADLTYLEFSNWLAVCTKYAKRPVIFAGELIFAGLSWWLGERGLQTRQDETTLGIAVSNFKTIYGQTVNVIPHRDLLVNKYAGYAFCVDLDDVKYKYLDGEDTHMEEDIQLPGDKQMINEYRTWFGAYIGNPKRHGMIKDVATISA